jgi:hypothetical protein
MTRAVTFWYTKQLPIFENNDDMAVTKIDVTRYQSQSKKLGRIISETMNPTLIPKFLTFLII